MKEEKKWLWRSMEYLPSGARRLENGYPGFQRISIAILRFWILFSVIFFMHGSTALAYAYTSNISTSPVQDYKGVSATGYGYYGENVYFNLWDADETNTLYSGQLTVKKDGTTVKTIMQQADGAYVNWFSLAMVFEETGTYTYDMSGTTVSGGTYSCSGSFAIYDRDPVISSQPSDTAIYIDGMGFTDDGFTDLIHYSDTTASTGRTVDFTVEISAGTNVRYQWFWNTTGGNTSGTAISGATAATLSLDPVTADLNGRYYYCTVTNNNKDEKCYRTNAAKLTVYSLPTVIKPTAQTVISGSKATFSVAVSGGNPNNYTYQWYCSTSSSELKTGTAINGANSPSYSVTASPDNHKTYYYCEVSTGDYRVTTYRACLTVYWEPVVSAPEDQAVLPGETAAFSVTAGGGNPTSYTYQWYYADSAEGNGTAISGATFSSYSVTGDAGCNGRYYYCEVSNGQYTVSSNRARLTVTASAAGGTGAAGSTGITGGAGSTGSTGITGGAGSTGSTGTTGGAGSTGGSTGTTGGAGSTGSAGTASEESVAVIRISSLKSKATGKFTLQWQKNREVTGYQIQYSTNKKFTSVNKITIKNNSTEKKTVKDLSPGKRYYVRIRGYKKDSGKTLYGEWSSIKGITVKDKTAGSVSVKSEFSKVYKKNSTFKLNAKGSGKLTYSSNKKSVVTVSSAGKVTIKGYGKAVIKVTSAETSTRKKKTVKVQVQIVPAAVKKFAVVSNKKKTLSVTWQPNGDAERYEIQISADKTFPEERTVSVRTGQKNKATVSSKLKRGTTYYVRMRCCKKVGSTTVNSAWSSVKKVKVK